MAKRGKAAPEDDNALGKAVPVQARPVQGAPVQNGSPPDEPTEASKPKLAPVERAITFRVTWVVILAFVLSWSLLIVGAIVMEGLGRDRVSLFVAERVQSMMSLGPEHPINVDIGGAPLVFQLVNQRLDSVTVTTPDVALGELVGDIRLTAEGVPFDTTQPFDRVFAEVRVAEALVSRIASSVTNATITSVELVEPEVKLGTTVTVPGVEIFGIVITPEFTFDVGIGMEPFVAEGAIAFMPTSFELNGNVLSAEAFADAYRNAAQSLLQVGAICVADQLPVALVLEAVEVDGSELLIGLGADNAVFSNESLATKGECA